MINLTTEMIARDIEKFNERIQIAKDQLARLPVGYLEFKKHKRREKQRRDLRADISHIETLKKYARKALRL